MINKITQKLPQFAQLKLRQAVVTKNILNGKQIIEIVLAYPKKLNAYDRATIEDVTNEILPPKYIAQVGFEYDQLDGEVFLLELDKWCLANCTTLAYRLKGCINYEIMDGILLFNFTVDNFTVEVMERLQLFDRLREHFASYTCYDVDFAIAKRIEDETLESLLEQSTLYQELQVNRELSKPKRYLAVTDIVDLIGKKITLKPRYIIDLQATQTLVTVCGRVHDCKIVEYVKPAIKGTPEEKDAEKSKLIAFTLTDYTASVHIVHFLSKENVKKAESLTNGDEIVVQGTIQTRDNQVSIRAFNICRCKITAEQEQPKNSKPIPAQYLIVKPKRIVIQKQANLEEAVASVPKFLAENPIVCLNVETNGENIRLDKIVKISAVKLVGGQIKESFSTLVNPEVQLSPEELKELGTTAKSLAEKPVILDVIPDLYKFCAENVLVVFNADVSLSFIKYYAYASNYDFKGTTHDILDLAIKVLPPKEQGLLRTGKQDLVNLATKLAVKDIETYKDKAVLISQILIKLVNTYDNLL